MDGKKPSNDESPKSLEAAQQTIVEPIVDQLLSTRSSASARARAILHRVRAEDVEDDRRLRSAATRLVRASTRDTNVLVYRLLLLYVLEAYRNREEMLQFSRRGVTRHGDRSAILVQLSDVEHASAARSRMVMNVSEQEIDTLGHPPLQYLVRRRQPSSSSSSSATSFILCVSIITDYQHRGWHVCAKIDAHRGTVTLYTPDEDEMHYDPTYQEKLNNAVEDARVRVAHERMPEKAPDVLAPGDGDGATKKKQVPAKASVESMKVDQLLDAATLGEFDEQRQLEQRIVERWEVMLGEHSSSDDTRQQHVVRTLDSQEALVEYIRMFGTGGDNDDDDDDERHEITEASQSWIERMMQVIGRQEHLLNCTANVCPKIESKPHEYDRFKCSRCQVVVYCSNDCRKIDARTHRSECRDIAKKDQQRAVEQRKMATEKQYIPVD